MPTKKQAKKETTEKSHEQEENKTTLQKEEIKEIVAETVTDTLEKLAEDDPVETKNVEGGETKEKTEEKPVVPNVVMPSEDDSKEIAEEASAEDHEGTKTPSPVMPEVIAPEAPSGTSGEEKTESETVPSAPSIAAPISPSGEAISTANATATQPKKKSSLLGVFLLIIILGALAGGGWYAYTNKIIPTQLFSLAGVTGHTASTPTAHQTPTATPTPAPVDLSQYTISILNGSGVPGAAAKTKNDLTTAGFTVNSTGNASTSGATDTVIAAKSAVSKGYLDKLTEELQKTYAVSATVTSLDDSATTDVTVIIGSATAH